MILGPTGVKGSVQKTQLGGPDPGVPEPQRPQAFPVVLQRTLGVEEISALINSMWPPPISKVV